MMFTPYGAWLLFNSSELGDHSCNPFLGLWDKSAKEADPEIFRWNSSRFQNLKAYRVGNTQSEIQFSYVCCMFLVKISPKFQEHLRSRKVSSHHQKPQHNMRYKGQGILLFGFKDCEAASTAIFNDGPPPWGNLTSTCALGSKVMSEYAIFVAWTRTARM